jgi:hypothetical protein
MSTALAALSTTETRDKQAPAGVGATLAWNKVITEALPPIVKELEAKIAALQEKVDNIKRPAGTASSAINALRGRGRRTRRSRH